MPSIPSRLLLVSVALLAALALTACGDTLQIDPLNDKDLTRANGAPFPVYWVGRVFHGMPVSYATPQPGGSVLVTYGNCVVGGQNTCVRPLTIVTSHDNSFVPGATHTRMRRLIRGRTAVVAIDGTTLEIATGPVVVDVLASTPALAQAAAQSMTPLNAKPKDRTGGPGSPLPPPLPANGFAQSSS